MSFPSNLPQLLADQNTSFWFPPEGSTFAREVDSTYEFIYYVCLVFFVAIVWCLFYFSWKYHQPKGGKATSRATHHTLIEIVWSVGPSFLLVFMFVKGTWAYLDMKQPPADATPVEVEAQKWSWLFKYGNGISHPELHVLKDRPTKLTMRSKDVLHACFIPVFRAKQDVVPGRYTTLWFQPTISTPQIPEPEAAALREKYKGQEFNYRDEGVNEEGYKFFDLYCAEYCGKDHSMMQTRVVVHETKEDLDAWLVRANRKPDGVPAEEYGRIMYEQRGCKGCHSIDGAARTGPTFKDSFGTEHKFVDGTAGIMDENYVKESIVNPRAKVVQGFQPVMPTFKGQLTDEQIDCLVAYIKSLKK